MEKVEKRSAVDEEGPSEEAEPSTSGAVVKPVKVSV